MALRYTIIDNTTSTTTPINEPVGFDKITLHLGRDKQYHGFIDAINDTLGAMQFHSMPGGGFDILQTAFQDFGIDADVQLLIEYACNDSTTYSTMYQGRFNFSKYKEVTGINGCYIEIGADNGNWLMWFKNRMDHDVPLDSLQPFDLGYAQLAPYPGLGTQIVLPAKSIRQTDYAVYNYIPDYYAQP